MNYIESKYVNLLSGRLDKFVRKKDGLWNFRCPYCGDSKKYKNKARGYFIRVKTDLIYKCHNCGVGRSFPNFLKEQAVDLHDEYVMERYKEGLTGKGRYVKSPESLFTVKKPKTIKIPDGLQTIASLNKEHPAKDYILKRGIPEKYHTELYYAEKFQAWVNTQKHTYSDESLKYDHPRVIIPLIEGGSWFGFQGRSLDPKDKMRYVTVILEDDKKKIYGLNHCSFDETLFVTEGPIDSLFLKNAIAMVGADVDWKFAEEKNVVFVYDNEPRNEQIVRRMQTVIDRGLRLVIWPKHIQQKDINDMVQAGHTVQSIVECNTTSGLKAQLTLNDWKRVL